MLTILSPILHPFLRACAKNNAFSNIFSDSWPFWHFLNLAWPKDGHLEASVKLFFDFPKPCMARKYSFQCFQSSCGHFWWPIPKLIFGISYAWLKNVDFEILNVYFWLVSALGLTLTYFELLEVSFWEFLGPWIGYYDFELCLYEN